MSFNLIRNARVFFTTSVDSTTGIVNRSTLTAANTREIQVLDGFSFSQASSQETVTLNEAGPAPIRGQRSFNTALDPVDFSFSTYVRPQTVTNGKVTAEESVLWNAMFAVDAIGGSEPAWVEADASAATCTPAYSNEHQLQKFGLIVIMDNTAFVIDNCVLNEATLDFGIDAISMISWTGQGTKLNKEDAPALTESTGVVTMTGTGWDDGAGGGGKAAYKDVDADYIANKLSLVTVGEGINDDTTTYSVAITGGSLTISNNVTFLVPANLGIVNQPITYFTGTRSVTGTLSAYLRTGGELEPKTTELLDSLLAAAEDDDTPYNITINIGGNTTNTPHVNVTLPACVISIPEIATEQVVSTTINFTAQGYAGEEGSEYFDITATNEIAVEYNAAP